MASRHANGRKRILFVAEAATLAHVARPLVLSAAMDPEEYEVGFACDPRCRWLLGDLSGCHLPLRSESSDHFLDALSRGKPLYDESILDRYVRDDLRLFDEFRPAVVVGDFRLSLSISARLRRIPYLAVSNCYWSPYWRPPRYVVPNIRWLTGTVPLPIADVVFRLARPLAFALHCRPLNRVRRAHGLPPLGNDLRRIYTDADVVLYADIPQLFPGVQLPANHRFIGPLSWAPPVATPDWWQTLPRDRPIVYVTLGSSGQTELLAAVLQSLAGVDITVIAATAGARLENPAARNAYVAQYLPGEEAARRSRLVICNGGSPTSQQALTAGVPVIGIASNLDQFLNMGAIAQAGAGGVIRADRFNGRTLAALVMQMLSEREHTAAAQRIAAGIPSNGAGRAFTAVVSKLVAP